MGIGTLWRTLSMKNFLVTNYKKQRSKLTTIDTAVNVLFFKAIFCTYKPVLGIRIRMDPELFVGSGTRGVGSGSGSESKTSWKNA
jgi:hypothetical protein